MTKHYKMIKHNKMIKQGGIIIEGYQGQFYPLAKDEGWVQVKEGIIIANFTNKEFLNELRSEFYKEKTNEIERAEA